MHVLEEKKVPFRMMISVTHLEEEKKINKVMDSLHIPISYRCRGQGTAPSEILDILGFRGTARLVTISFLPKFKVQKVFERMSEKMSFKKKGGGIVLTIPITGLQNTLFRMLSEENKE
ncbi:MAG TPA: transcriptional regulator, partial [Candidatus Choladousia intestinigallinarum]|nr:transcriptional regulator [Candidatus Choladousia intestinigallinarum]